MTLGRVGRVVSARCRCVTIVKLSTTAGSAELCRRERVYTGRYCVGGSLDQRSRGQQGIVVLSSVDRRRAVADPGIPKRGCGTWGLGDGSTPSGSQGRARVGVWGQSPQKLRTLCYIHNSQQVKTSIQRHIQHDKNRTNLAQEIKLVWSSQSELVNDFDRFDWRRLRMYTWISANDVSRSSLIDV